MNENSRLLDDLLAGGEIALLHGRLLAEEPPALPAGFTWDRIEGMMLGLAIGDALGRPTESMVPRRRREENGEIRDYTAHRKTGETGVPSDDTQLAFWTLDELTADGGFEPEDVAARFARERIFGMGSAIGEALQNHRYGALPWYACGAASAGNGALMRIAPMLVPYVRSPSSGLWADTALSAIVTHNDAASTSACLAFVAMLWELLGMEAAPEPSWWPKTYVARARDLEGGTHYRPRGGVATDFLGPLWRYVEEQVPAAYDNGLSALEACDSWYSGAYLLETVPCVLSILMRHAGDPEEAIVRAVNDTRDNDTMAAIVGAAVGALHGAAALPERWLSGLKGRTRADDDGEVQRVLERARVRWWG